MRSHPIRFALTVFSLLVVAAMAGADAMDNLKNTSPAQRAAVQDALMKEMFSPTPELQSKLTALNLRYAEKMEPFLKGEDGYFSRMRAMKNINDEKEAELEKLLTPEQWATYVDGKADMRKKFDARIAALQP